MYATAINNVTVGTSSSEISDGISLSLGASSFSLYYEISGDGDIDFFYHASVDGENFVKDTRAFKRGLTKTSGPDGDGKGILQIPVRYTCNSIKIEAENTDASNSAVVTAKLGYRPNAFEAYRYWDGPSKAATGIDMPHHKIHEEDGYFAIRSELLDTDGDVEVRFATPDTTKWAHMTIDVEAALAATVELWIDTTKTHESGNAITPLNRNFNSSNSSGLTVCHTPGGTQSGDANLIEYVGASSTSGRVAAGGESQSRAEFILEQNTAYYIKATSRADGNAISIILDWYEHTNR